LLDTFTYLPLVQAFFLAALVGYICFLIGYRTKAAHIVAFVFFLSVTNRNLFVGHSGDVVILTMLAWSLFLPLGSRFSVDAVLRAMKQGVDLRRRAIGAAASGTASQTVDLPPDRADLSPPSMAAFAIVCQIVVIYVTSAYAKCGGEWAAGTAVWYTLQLDQFATPAGRWAADGPMPVLMALNHATIVIEYSALLILVPFWQPFFRRLAIILLTSFHLGTAATMVLGTFPFIMIFNYALLLLPADWALIRRVALRWSRPVTVYYDDTCGFCYRCMQLLAIADTAHYIRFIGNTDRTAFEHKLRHSELAASIVVFDDATQSKNVRSAAMASIFAALPLPWHVFRIVAWPGVRALSDRVYDVVARNRYRVSTWLGYQACGLDQVPIAAGGMEENAPLVLTGRSLQHGIANVVAGILLAFVLVNTYNNTWTDCLQTATIPEPPLMFAALQTTQLVHSWGMFAPPMKADGWWVIDGVTLSGKRVDPLTGAPPTFEKPPDLARNVGPTWRMYLDRLSWGRNVDFRVYFAKYVTRKHHREHPEDPLDHFNFYYVEEYTQSPGTPKPWPTEILLLWEHDCFAGDRNPPRNRPPRIPTRS
jgi:predicted DCC family thiol-disulfide oxidoreductase YuxK